MLWVPNKAILRRGLVAALLLTGAASAAANVLVVRSAGPSARAYPAGRSLPDNARITLRADDTFVVLAGGGTRTFRGPGTFSPTAAVQAGRRGRRRATAAAPASAPCAAPAWSRGARPSGMSTSPRAAPSASPAARNVMLWRPDASAPTRLTITGPGGRRASAAVAGRTADARLAARHADRQRRQLQLQPARRRGADPDHLPDARLAARPTSRRSPPR